MRFELLDHLPDGYEALFARSSATAFQHPIWVRNFVRHLVPGRRAHAVFACAFDGNELGGMVALTLRRKNGLRLLEAFDLGVCDYVAPVVVGDEDEIAQGLRSVLPRYDMLRINNVRPEQSAFWEAFAGEAHEPAGFSAHATSLAGTFMKWREASLDPSLASQTKRKAKRWARDADVRCERLAKGDAAKAVRTLACLRAGRFDGDPIQGTETAAFYAAVAEEGADGFCETWALTADGETAGLLLGITHREAFHYLLIGCDYERFARHSPGQQLYERVIEDWIGRGGTLFDFTIGDEPFKRQYGTVATPMSRFCVARTWPGRLGQIVLERRGQAA